MARFISIEGGEGVGKSSFIGVLTKRLSEMGINCHTTCEPGGTPIGQRLREVFVNPPEGQMHILTEFLLVSAARSQHVHELINSKLTQGTWVITDRYADSSRVYQGVLGGIASDTIEFITDVATSGLVPDMTFVLDCDLEIAQKRVKSRGETLSRFDAKDMDYHRRIQKAFRNLVQRHPERMLTIDASQDLEQIADIAMEHLKSRGLVR
jgi:dTMP kinase